MIVSNKQDNKKLPQLVDNLKSTYLVQKSNPLLSLWKSDLTLFEFKLLDCYLGRIDSRKSDQRSVRFGKGEIERLLGVKQIRPNELKERLSHLMGQVVEIRDKDVNRGFVLITLFEQAECEKDEYGIWQVDLECTQKAMKYFFNIEKLGFIRYQLRNIINLKSRYSYVMFVYLESNRFRRTWEVELEELKQILSCSDDVTYNEYKRFNDLILKKCKRELLDKTEVRYTYESIKKGRRVVKIKFTIEPLAEVTSKIQDTTVYPEQLSLDDYTENEDTEKENTEYADSWLNFLSSACKYEFSEKEMEVIFNMINTMDLPDNPNGVWFARYHYLAEKYSTLNLAAERTKINDRYSYLRACIESDRKW